MTEEEEPNPYILYLLNIEPFNNIGLLLTYLVLMTPFDGILIALLLAEECNKGLLVLCKFFFYILKVLYVLFEGKFGFLAIGLDLNAFLLIRLLFL